MTDALGPYKLGPGDTENWGVVTGDAKELCWEIPDESVDFILADPIYDNFLDYHWLAKTAARILKPDSACLVWYGIGYAPQIHADLSRWLSYRWRLVVRTVWSNEFHGRLIVGTQECLWYEKGHSKPLQSIFDLEMATMKGKGNFGKNGANWGKHEGVTMRYIDTFCKSDGIVFDPFCGSGTVPAAAKMLNRRWLAFEIDPDTANDARQRIRDTQPPLPGLTVRQERMSL